MIVIGVPVALAHARDPDEANAGSLGPGTDRLQIDIAVPGRSPFGIAMEL